MNINGIGSAGGNAQINDVLNNINNTATDVNNLAQQGATGADGATQEQITLMASTFFSILNKVMEEAKSNAGS